MATIKVEVEVEVPEEDWILFLIQHPDIFGRNYCGYWLRGVEHDPKLGWLCWEDDEQHRCDKEPDRAWALAAWRSGSDLPTGWFRLDRAAAERAFGAGCKRWGADWFEQGDATRYDVVLQLALLGEIRYG